MITAHKIACVSEYNNKKKGKLRFAASVYRFLRISMVAMATTIITAIDAPIIVIV